MAPPDTPTLTDSSRAVLRVLASQGPVTRPRLGQILELSKPTMSAAVAELSALGLVASRGSQKGALGRTAAVYGLGPAAGYVIGIDVGASQVRAMAQSLDGRRLASVEESAPALLTASPDEAGEVIASAAREAIRAVGRRIPLRSVAVAVPRIVSQARLGRDPNGPDAALRRLRAETDAAIILENNVNCAAVGEMQHGAARGFATFVYLQVGVRIGLGIVSEGRLFRGFGGAAGEVGRLPFPWSPTDLPTREGLEHYLGSGALIERCARDWPADAGPPPRSAKELFGLAEAGSEPARARVMRHAGDIGRVVAACVGLLDPGLVVLGGGVGQNPLMAGEVERVASELTWPTRIAVSALGEAATALGAMKLAADYSLGLLLREDRHPAVVLPPPDLDERAVEGS